MTTKWIRGHAPLLILALAGASLLGLAWVFRRPSQASANERSTMPMPTQPALRTAQLPPIDAAAPARIETATFAMG